MHAPPKLSKHRLTHTVQIMWPGVGDSEIVSLYMTALTYLVAATVIALLFLYSSWVKSNS